GIAGHDPRYAGARRPTARRSAAGRWNTQPAEDGSEANMTWAQFYLICFLVGFVFSLLSFVMGGLRWHVPFHIHWPHVGGGHLHHGIPAHGGAHKPSMHAHISPFNPSTIAAFLVWFGGAGYLLTRYSSFWVITGLGFATVVGVIGGSIVFLFLT